MPTRILVCGAAVLDYTIVLSSHPPSPQSADREQPMEALIRGFGGCAFNIAHNLRLLGQFPVMAAAAGDDFNAEYRLSCVERTIDVSRVAVASGPSQTATCVAIRAGGTLHQTYYAPGPLLPDAGYARRVLSESFDGIVLAADRAENIACWLDALCELELPFLFAPGPDVFQLPKAHLARAVGAAACLHVNEAEWREVLHVLGRNPLGDGAHNFGAVVTMGSRGSRMITATGELESPAIAVERVLDATGCGDAHLAGFATGLYGGLGLMECLQLGNAIASFCAGTIGTQSHNPSAREIDARAAREYGLAVNEILAAA